jgi:hypothetical protein
LLLDIDSHWEEKKYVGGRKKMDRPILHLHVDTAWHDEGEYDSPHDYDSPSVFSPEEERPLAQWSRQTASSPRPPDERRGSRCEKAKGKERRK